MVPGLRLPFHSNSFSSGDDMHAHLQEQKAHTDEDLNTLFLFRRKYPTDTPEFENFHAWARVKTDLSTGTNCRGFYVRIW